MLELLHAYLAGLLAAAFAIGLLFGEDLDPAYLKAIVLWPATSAVLVGLAIREIILWLFRYVRGY